MKFTKMLSAILATCMLISVSALATDGTSDISKGGGASAGMPDTSKGGSATSAPPDNSTKAVNLLGAHAALYYEYSDKGYTLYDHSDTTDGFKIQNKLTTPTVGKEYSISGINIQYDSIDYDTENTVGNSGIVINSKTDTSTPFTIGGDDDFYTVDDKGYNSVIVMQATDDEYQDTKATESSQGVGIAYNGSLLTLDNVYLEANGSGRPNVLIPSSQRDKNVTQAGELVVKNSYIKNDSTRALLLMGGDVFFYNSDIVTNKWGCLSFDNTSSTMYAVNNNILVDAVTGYGTYVAAGCTVNFYGVHDISGDNAVRICRDGAFYCDSLQNADDKALAHLSDKEKNDLLSVDDSRVADYDGQNMLAGGYAGITVHADMAGQDTQASATIKNSILSTLPEDVVYSDGTNFDDVAARSFYYNRNVSNYFTYELVHGADILVTSHSAKFDLDNVEMKSSTGVLVHTVYGYDSMASGIYPADGVEYVGDEVNFSNMDVKGDVIHEDYMRKMLFSLDNTSFAGAVVSGTVSSWNSHWSDLQDPSAELQSLGVDTSGVKFDHDTVLSELIRDEAYKTIWGVRMNVDSNSQWTVTGNSSLYSLCLEKGATIKAPADQSIEIYVNVEMNSEDEFYDWTTGTKVDSLDAGKTYTGVVILVNNAGEGVSKITAAAPAASQIQATTQKLTVNAKDTTLTSYEIGGDSYVKLRDLATLLSGTNSEFSISYDNGTRVITVDTGKLYVPVGGELAAQTSYDGSCVVSNQPLVVDGKTVNVKTYNISGNNYLRLSDISIYLDFNAEYDAQTGTILVTTAGED